MLVQASRRQTAEGHDRGNEKAARAFGIWSTQIRKCAQACGLRSVQQCGVWTLSVQQNINTICGFSGVRFDQFDRFANCSAAQCSDDEQVSRRAAHTAHHTASPPPLAASRAPTVGSLSLHTLVLLLLLLPPGLSGEP